MAERREIEADFVIVGTGAGGATAARVLSAAGYSVLMCEEGPLLSAAERPRAVLDAMRLTFRGNGMMVTRGPTPLPVLQGCLVGGSTAINSGIVWRMPQDVRSEWREQHGLGELVNDAVLDASFERIERELAIADTPSAVLGRNATLMAEACAKLDLPGKVIARNVRDCAGSSRCLQGCPKGARQSMDVSYVPRAIRDGAQLWPLARVSQIEVARGRAVGVRGELLDRERRRPSGSFRARARRGVIIAAGAVHSPLLLWRAGLRGLVGQRFQAHPGAAVVGLLDEPIVQGFGATQAYEVPMRERGYKIETLNMPPELLAARMPGVGESWQKQLAELDRVAHWVAQVRMRALGSVRPGWLGPVIRYEPLPEDLLKLREALIMLVRMFFAIGARAVSPGIADLPPYLTSMDQLALLERTPLLAGQTHLLASHLFGTCCAGSDPRRSVVGPSLESHELPGLYVMDASVFPTNLGVNPQHSIMALCFIAAERLANRERR